MEPPISPLEKPSADFTWAHSRFESGTGALAYNLFTEEICQQLRDIQIEEVQVLGIRYNDYGDEDFSRKQWRKPVEFEVVPYELERFRDGSAVLSYRWLIF